MRSVLRTPAGAGRRRAFSCGRNGPARRGSCLRLGDRRHPGIVAAGFGIGVAVGVVTKFSEYPGLEDLPETWLAQIDFSVRVSAKRLSHLLTQNADLSGQGGYDGDQRRSGGRVGTDECRPGGELLGAQLASMCSALG